MSMRLPKCHGSLGPVIVDGIRIWKCSHCGKEQPWGEGWASYGPLSCSMGHEPCVQEVACSEACRKALRKSHPKDPALASERRGSAKQADETYAALRSILTAQDQKMLRAVAAWCDEEYRLLSMVPTNGPTTNGALSLGGSLTTLARLGAELRAWAETGREPPHQTVKDEWRLPYEKQAIEDDALLQPEDPS